MGPPRYRPVVTGRYRDAALGIAEFVTDLDPAVWAEALGGEDGTGAATTTTVVPVAP